MLNNSNSKETSNLWGYLTLILPVSFGIVLTLESWRVCLALVTTAGAGWAWKRYRRQQQNKLAHLDTVFYQLIQENKGRVTTLDLAMKAKIPGEQVQKYLDKRAKEFAAEYEITEQGGIIYWFQSAQSVDPVDRIEMPTVAVQTPSEAVRKSPELFPLSSAQTVEKLQLSCNQSELARRFNVHPNTIGKWKAKPEFLEWSRQKDPEAIAWEYSAENKRFYPKLSR